MSGFAHANQHGAGLPQTKGWAHVAADAPVGSTQLANAPEFTLVAERNALVHHFLPRWKPHDIEHCRALSIELDEQQNRIIRAIERHRAYESTVQKMSLELKAFLDSDEGKRQFDLACLQQSQLAATLLRVTKEQARPDGWVLLSTAGDHLQRLLPEEFSNLKAQHGSLQKLVQAMQLFDVAKETSNTGESRVLYRVRLL